MSSDTTIRFIIVVLGFSLHGFLKHCMYDTLMKCTNKFIQFI